MSRPSLPVVSRRTAVLLSVTAVVTAVLVVLLTAALPGAAPDETEPVAAAPEPSLDRVSAVPPTPAQSSDPKPVPPSVGPAVMPSTPDEWPTTMSAGVTLPSEVSRAGLSDPDALEPSDSVTVTTDGETIQDLDISGTITVKANDVTIRNVRLRSNSNSFGINIARGSSGTLIEHVEVEMGTGGTEGNGAIGGLGDHDQDAGTEPGDNVTVRLSRLTGTADGIKAANASLYEYNVIAMRQGDGSAKHIDGIQSSGRSNWVARYNWVDQAYDKGHNGAIFAQAYTGKQDVPVSGIVIEHNWVNGGTFTIQTEDGKDGSGYLSAVIQDNVFYDDFKYGVYRPRGEIVGNGGIWADSKEPVTTGKVDRG